MQGARMLLSDVQTLVLNIACTTILAAMMVCEDCGPVQQEELQADGYSSWLPATCGAARPEADRDCLDQCVDAVLNTLGGC